MFLFDEIPQPILTFFSSSNNDIVKIQKLDTVNSWFELHTVYDRPAFQIYEMNASIFCPDD